MITGKINVMKIDKAKLFEGKKGAKWLDIVLIETPNSEYGDYMIVQNASKEERAAGKRGEILGNATVFQKRGGPAPAVVAPKVEEGEDDVPF